MNTFWSILADIAAIVTVITLPYLLVNARRRAPRFSFTFHGRGRNFFTRDNMEWCRLTFTGTIRNQSLDANTIEKIYYVVWRKGRKGYRSFGWSPQMKIEEDSKALKLPIEFGPRQARTVEITHDLVLTGTHDMQLVHATENIDGSLINLPKHQYELVFEDVMGNLFDEKGMLVNGKGAELRWTLDNAIDQAKDGKLRPLLKHLTQIYLVEVVFIFRRLIRRLGL